MKEKKEFKGIFKLKNEDYTSDNNIINIGKNIQKCLFLFAIINIIMIYLNQKKQFLYFIVKLKMNVMIWF